MKYKVIGGEVETFDILRGIEFMQPTEIVFYKAQPQARQLTKTEAGAIVNAVIEQYAAEHKVNYPAAVKALRDESPELFQFWQQTK